MASKPVKPEAGTEAESTKNLLSTISHLMGLKEGKDGKLEVTGGGSSAPRSDVFSIGNLRTDCAQQWRPGALLDAVADLGILPPPEVGRIREQLNIRKAANKAATSSVVSSGATGSGYYSTTPTYEQPVLRPPEIGRIREQLNIRNRNAAINPGPDVSPRGNCNIIFQPPVHSPPTAPTFKTPVLLPPRSVQAASSKGNADDSSSSNDDILEPPQKKQFTFNASKLSSNTSTGYDNGISSSNTLQANPGGRTDPSPLYSVPISKPPVKPLVSGNAEEPPREAPTFRTAAEYLMIEDKKKGIVRNYNGNGGVSGLRRPTRTDPGRVARAAGNNNEDKPISDNPEVVEIMENENMKNVDPKMVEAIINEVVQIAETKWDDIAGLEAVKTTIQEIIILPMLRPDLFTGIRSPAKGILFFGPPGTGKTMFGRLIATQSKSTFFNISASSLTSKWIGDGEKMVRALFAVARVKQPSVIFIDEIDSILTQRSDTEHESSRRLKTEFLIQFDGAATQNEDRILVIGVTNRPQELDEAARRRLVKRIYIPLPDLIGRKQIVKNLTEGLTSSLQEEDYDSIAEMSAGYSGADMNSLCKEAALGPLRDVPRDALQDIHASQVRCIQMKDFVSAQKVVKSSVAESDVMLYEEWNTKFGCHS